MNKHLLKISGLAACVLLLQVSGFAQSGEKGSKTVKSEKDTSVNHLHGYDEIIIKRKSDKDAKVSVEIKNGEVYINGKPAADYSDDDLSVRKRKVKVMDGRTFSFSGPGSAFAWQGDGDGPDVVLPPPGAPGAPGAHGGGWNYRVAPRKVGTMAYLGVATERAAEGDGAKITSVSDSSAAAKAGLKQGDIITKINDISVDNPQELSDAVHQFKPDEKVTVTFVRDGKKQTVQAVLGKTSGAARVQAFGYGTMPGMPGLEGLDDQQLGDMLHGFDGKGFNNPIFSPRIHGRLGIKAQDTEDGKGVKVLDVNDESAAAKAGVKEGDIITQFNGKKVNSATELAEAAQAAKGESSFHINLLRDGKPLEMDVKIPKKLKTADL